MMAKTPSQLIPRIRFPEFQGAKEWDDVPIATLLTVRDERQAPTDKMPLYSLTIEDGITPKSARYNREFLVADPSKKKYKLVEPQDIVFNPSNLRWGAINYSRLNHSVVVSPIYEVLYVTDSSATCFDFVARALMRPEQIARFIEKGQGTLVERIAVKVEFFVETTLPIPVIYAEQQKISDCLASLDDLIAAEGRMLEALRQHKRGLMQQLFSQLGETAPRLRFPEFLGRSVRDDQINDVCELKAGDYVPASEIVEQAGEGLFPCYGGNGLRGYVETHTHKGQYVLIGRQGALCGNVNLFSGKFHATEHALVVTPRSGIDTKWLFFALDALNLNRFSVGQAQPGLSVAVLKEIGISVPDELDEQKKIANCLGSLDDLIAAKVRMLEVLRQHKKGLLQKLFPSLEGL